MQKYKKGQDQCGQLSKPTKQNPVTSVNSNKSLLKFSTNTQNKSTTSVLNPHEHSNNHPPNPNSKSLKQKNKSSKHLESHTFATNTHQNSINVVMQSTSHNNSKSNKKGSGNVNKKSNGKKVTKEKNDGSKMMGEHGRTVSQYENLSFVGKDKNDLAKNYKNVLKARKQQKSINYLITNNNKQPKDLLSNALSKQRQHIKTTSQLTKKSINISSMKQLKPQSKSRSKSKQFQKMSKKSHNSKKHLLTEISHTVTVKENNMNVENSKSLTRRDGKDIGKLVGNKKGNVSSASHLFSSHLFGIQNKQKSRPKPIPLEEYERVPMHIFKSSTNSDIEYSNIDENTVKSIINHKKISNQPYFYTQDNQNDIVFCSDDDFQGEEVFGNQRIREDLGKNLQKKEKNKQQNDRKKQNLSKRYSKMKLELSPQCFNCLTEPDYLIEPKGIRHLYTAYPNNEQSLKTSNPLSSSSSKQIYEESQKSLLKNINHKKSDIYRKSAIKIQKVWRGYMTRKLLAMYIEEEEIKLERRMKELGQGKNVNRQIKVEMGKNDAYLIDGQSYEESQEQQIDAPDHQNLTSNELDQSSIPQQPYYQQSSICPPLQNPTLAQINNSLNTLDYESQILPRQEQETISFLGQINNINLRGYSLVENDLVEENQGVMYTSVESVEGKVEEIFQEKDQFGDKLVEEIGDKVGESINRSASYQQPQPESYQNNESYQIDSQLVDHKEQSKFSNDQLSYQDPTTILNPPQYTKQSDSYVINESSLESMNIVKKMQNIEESQMNSGYELKHQRNESSYRIEDEDENGERIGGQDQEEVNDQNDDNNDNNYEDDSLELPQQPSVIIENSLKQYHYQRNFNRNQSLVSQQLSNVFHQDSHHQQAPDESYIPDPSYFQQSQYSHINQSLWQPKHSQSKNIQVYKSYSEQLSSDLGQQMNNQESQHLNESDKMSEDKNKQKDKKVEEESFKLDDEDENFKEEKKDEVSYQIEEDSNLEQNEWTELRQKEIQEEYRVKKHAIDSNQFDQSKQNCHQYEIPAGIKQDTTKPIYTSKSNPNIMIVKSPKHHHQFIKASFISADQQANQPADSFVKVNDEKKQGLQKTSSVKQILMKKSFFNQNNMLSIHNQRQQFPHHLSFLPYPTQKQANSIQSLLHFRHQCLTHQHSQEFNHIQEQYIKQQITKEQFITKLNQLAKQFESSAVDIKQTEKDIFNGYKALLKLIKDVVKDCKTLGFSQQKGSNVRFCRSMELFGGGKMLLRGGKDCVFGDQFRWKFDDVMIDQMDKSKRRNSLGEIRKSQQSKEQEVQKQEKVQQVPQDSFEESMTSNSSSIFSTSNIMSQQIPITIPSQQKSSSSSQQKQLSRQSSSHHHLPQLILQPKQISPDKPLSISRKVLGFMEVNKATDDFSNDKNVQPERDYQGKEKEKEEKIYQPCSFDISELGECEDEYEDDDQEEIIQKISDKEKSPETNQSVKVQISEEIQQNPQYQCQPEQPWSLNQSGSYHIEDDDQQLFGTSPNHLSHEQKSLSQSPHKPHSEVNSPPPKDPQNESPISYTIPQQQLAKQAESYVSSPSFIISGLSNIISQQNKHSLIEHKNKQLSDEDQIDQDLLNNKVPELSDQKQPQSPDEESESDSQPQPLIKREVYQLSCDSDEEDEEMKLKVESMKGKKFIIREDAFKRMESYDCSRGEDSINIDQLNKLSQKYNSVANFITQIIVWQFIEEIILNKARNSKLPNSMGKRLSESAKFTSELTSYQSSNSSPQIDSSEQSNIVIITNSSAKQKQSKQRVQIKKEQHPKQVMGRITEDEIRSFLELLYREMPQYEQSRNKLTQRMYPNPLQLLKSLRDTEMQNYFKDCVSSNESRDESNEHKQNRLSSPQSSHSPSHSQVDSQTSYLQLGSYEFLLSQQLCEFIIEKYIAEVYELECQKKIKREKSEEGGLKDIKGEFNQYIEIKNMLEALKNNGSEDMVNLQRSSKQSQFQTLIRTRQLFCQHKQLQSQMLRKEIMKIQLHTILDAMNQELIKQRQSKVGYSGIGLNELAMGLSQRKGLQVTSEEEYDVLVSKAKYRLEKFVLNSEVDINDKLILQCQESVTMNDSQWVFYVTEALEFGLQIAKIVEEMVWEETVREISRMILKRKFTLQNCRWEIKRQTNVVKKSDIANDSSFGKDLFKSRKVVSINIVVPCDGQGNDEIPISHRESDSQPVKQNQYHHNNFIKSKKEPFDVSENSYQDDSMDEEYDQKTAIPQNQGNELEDSQNPLNFQNSDNSYQLDDQELDFNEDEQLEMELQNMKCDEQKLNFDQEESKINID